MRIINALFENEKKKINKKKINKIKLNIPLCKYVINFIPNPFYPNGSVCGENQIKFTAHFHAVKV